LERIMLHAVIMAGGAGTRFWPASRVDQPKQLLDFGLGSSLLQAAVARLAGLIAPENTLVVTNRRLVAPIRAQLPQLPVDAVLGEPCKRDTAACIGLAAAIILARDPEGLMLVTPADHVIRTDEQFQQAVGRAMKLVEHDPTQIVIFGIPPYYPAATFGYIERATEPLDTLTPAAYRVQRFREKPSTQVAEEYLAQGTFYWNAGIFLWRAQTIWDALARYEPVLHGHLEAIRAALGRSDFADVLEREFAAIVGRSIDFAVMEHYPNIAVVEAPFSWEDLGNWPSLRRLVESDADGNTIVGKHVGVRTRDCIVRSEGNHLITTLGVHDLIVVHTPDATLVANKHDEESVRELVKRLEALAWHEYL
jgi:mannose-1-phosphate guanylyltransferase